MSNKDFLEEKYIELNKLKSMILTYPEEYKNNLVEVMEKVCNQINSYLEEVSFHNKKRNNGILKLTEKELALYNGKNGMPAYISIDGTIYDISDVPELKDESHSGIKSGADYSELFKKCHNDDINILSKLKIVGEITAE